MAVVTQLQPRERGHVHERKAALLRPVRQPVLDLGLDGIGEPKGKHPITLDAPVVLHHDLLAHFGREPLHRVAIQRGDRCHAAIVPRAGYRSLR